MCPQCDYIIGGSLVRIEGRGAMQSPHSGFSPFKGTSTECPMAMRFLTQESFPAFEDKGVAPSMEYDFMDVHSRLYYFPEGGYLINNTSDGFQSETRFNLQSNIVRSNVCVAGYPPPHLFFHLLRTMYSFCALPYHIVPIHASVAVYHGKAILFIAPSGTGKSTHTELWRQYIPGTEQLNDDSPLLKITPSGPYVYGSPWSGKLPVYINRSYPLAAFVRIYQAPENRMKKESILGALGQLMCSCNSMLQVEESLMDIVCEIFSQSLKSVPMYSLECLPNKEAAEMVFYNLKKDGCIQ